MISNCDSMERMRKQGVTGSRWTFRHWDWCGCNARRWKRPPTCVGVCRMNRAQNRAEQPRRSRTLRIPANSIAASQKRRGGAPADLCRDCARNSRLKQRGHRSPLNQPPTLSPLTSPHWPHGRGCQVHAGDAALVATKWTFTHQVQYCTPPSIQSIQFVNLH